MSTKSVSKPEIFSTGHSDASAPETKILRSWYALTKSKTSTHPRKQSILPKNEENCLAKGKRNLLLSKSMEPTFCRLESKRSRDAFVAAELVNGLASQIRILRQQRGWSQKELAERLGTTQGVVSRLEDPSYGRFSVKTLLELASIFDVSVLAKFLPFSQAVPATWDTRREALEADSFDEDLRHVCFLDEVDSRYIANHSSSTDFFELLRNYNELELKKLGSNASSTGVQKKYGILVTHPKR
jgi:transcriptional regulator with XRE-family HTH domain